MQRISKETKIYDCVDFTNILSKKIGLICREVRYFLNTTNFDNQPVGVIEQWH